MGRADGSGRGAPESTQNQHQAPDSLTSSPLPVPGLSYPFVFACESCGTEVEVTRAEARDLSSNPDSLDAVDVVLRQEHRWMKDHRGAYCPDCEPLEEAE
jgi:hypothetical protein